MDYKIDDQYDQARLDRWLRTQFSGMPQSLIERSIRKKEIVVNGARSKASYRLQEGDVITILRHIDLYTKEKDKPLRHCRTDIEQLLSSVIFGNDDFIILNKPAGYAVQGGSGVKKSVIDLLNAGNTQADYKIVHRIDKETTGLLVVAKGIKSARHFAELFRTNAIRKTYIALVNGTIPIKSGIMQNKLLKVQDKVIVRDDGKDSLAKFEVICTFNNFSLVKVEPISGRMHQIRVQLAHLGYPIVGDLKYNSVDNEHKHLMLHASEIEFSDCDGEVCHFKAPLPNHFKKYLD